MIENDQVVVVCHGPNTHVYGPFVDESSAQEFIDLGPCDNDHEITRVIDDSEK